MLDGTDPLPVPLISKIGSKYNQQGHTRNEDANAVGMVQIIWLTTIGIQAFDQEIKYDGQNSGYWTFVECWSVDTEEEIYTVDTFKVVNHGEQW